MTFMDGCNTEIKDFNMLCDTGFSHNDLEPADVADQIADIGDAVAIP